jgi:hypothetical protein
MSNRIGTKKLYDKNCCNMKRKYKENNIVHHNFSCIFSYHVLLSFKFASFETGHKSVVFKKKLGTQNLLVKLTLK